MRIYLYTGTHWDREWYQPFQSFRLNLAQVLDSLIDNIGDAGSEVVFHMDGQTVVLEDYAEVRPERVLILEELIRAGRVKIGPWYCMPDEFLVSGEALIRNLQTGCSISRKIGVEPWKCGYVCDIFGHIAQLPRILNGFGIESAVVGRGANEHTAPPFFRWVSPGGNEVTAIKLPDKSGYSGFSTEVSGLARMGCVISSNSRDFRDRLRKLLDREISRANAPACVLWNSMDHEPYHVGTPEYLKEIKSLFPDDEVFGGDLLDVFSWLKTAGVELPARTGELIEPARDAGPFLFLLSGTLSSRQSIKRRNDHCQNLLEKQIEPLLAYCGSKGIHVPASFRRLAWKYLLQNQPHDSICGCSVDRVYKDMEFRFSQTENICEAITEQTVRFLSGGVAVVPPEGTNLTVFNPQPFAQKREVTATVVFSDDFPRRHEGFDNFYHESAANFRIVDISGEEIGFVTESVFNNGVKRVNGAQTVSGDLVALIFLAELPPLGLVSYRIFPAEKPVRALKGFARRDGSLDNGLVSVGVNPDGTINLTDKIHRKTYENLLGLSDIGDIGDGWNSAPPFINKIFTGCGTPSVSVILDSPVKSTVRVEREIPVPAGAVFAAHGISRSEELAKLVCVFDVSLYAGRPEAEVRLTVDNTARDHDLFLHIPTKINAKYTASQSFAFVERERGVSGATADWKETERLGKGTSGIVALRGSDGCGIAFVSEGGLHEIGVDDDPDSTIVVTLFRSVGSTFTTNGEPGGQELFSHEFRFAIAPFGKEVSQNELQRVQDRLQSEPICFLSKDAYNDSLINVTGNICVSAVLPGNDAGVLIVRLYNPSDDKVSGQIKTGFLLESAQICNLLEEPQKPAVVTKNIIEIALEAYEILCVSIRAAEGEWVAPPSETGAAYIRNWV